MVEVPHDAFRMLILRLTCIARRRSYDDRRWFCPSMKLKACGSDLVENFLSLHFGETGGVHDFHMKGVAGGDDLVTAQTIEPIEIVVMGIFEEISIVLPPVQLAYQIYTIHVVEVIAACPQSPFQASGYDVYKFFGADKLSGDLMLATLPGSVDGFGGLVRANWHQSRCIRAKDGAVASCVEIRVARSPV